jgi:putative membrane-bound dehydrogenase-like protein
LKGIRPAGSASKPASAAPGKKGGNAEAAPRGTVEIPPIVRGDGSDNGFFVHSRSLYWQNEETASLTDLVHRVSFNDILAQADLSPRGKSPQASRKNIHVRPGFTVELMAAEPLTYDPVAFAFGADGKLWVVEMGDYPLGTSTKRRGVPAGDAARSNDENHIAPAGRIRFLEDADGDGRYDKSTIFLDVPYPTGVLPWRKGILVTAAPDIFYAEDTDGDGRADRRETLYTGFNPGNQQHRANGLARGLDNWLYVANGDSGGKIRYVGPARDGHPPGKGKQGANDPVDIGGRDLRIRPETGELEAVTGQTQFGRNRDDWGNWFGCNNANPMYQFVLDDHYQRRNPHFAAPAARVDVSEVAGSSPVYPISRLLARFNEHHTANRFTSACSAIVYRDDLFGPHFAGNAFISEPVHNLVHREAVRPEGLLFRSRRPVDEEHLEFLASSDNWFRPTMIQTGPDGALWIADMYRHVIEHPEWIPDTWQKKLDLLAGFDQGRIYRVYPVDRQPRAILRLDQLPTAGLVAALDSPSGWQRDTAQQLLIERFGPGGPVLSRSQRRGAAECILLLEKTARESQNPLARLHALCTLSGIVHPSASLLLHVLADKHPGVRRHAVRISESLPRPVPEIVAALAKMTTDADPHVRMQLAYTLGAMDDPRSGLALGELLRDPGGDHYLFAAAMSSLTKTNIKQVESAVLGGDANATPNVNLLATLLNQAVLLGNDRAFHSLLAAVAAPRDGRFSPWQLTVAGTLFDALDRRRLPLADLRKSTDKTLREALGNLDRLLDFARETAVDDGADPGVRIAAVRVLGRDDEQRDADIERLAALLSSQTPPELQSAAVQGLGRASDPRIAGLLLEPWRGYGPSRKSQVLDVLLSREAWIGKLLDALEEHEVSPADFDAARREKLIGHKAEAIRARAAKLLAVTASASRQEVIEQYRPAIAKEGDSEQGARLFAKNCTTCHKLGGQGHEVGPDLASLTDKSPEALLVAILDPNRAVEAKFVSYAATTASGKTVTGILADETGNSITLRGPERKDQTILRSELDELTSTSKSAMPEGFEKDLSPTNLRDLIAYLRASAPAPQRKEFSGNSPELARPSAGGVILLTAATAEIFGATLIYEPDSGNLGYWSSLDDVAAWTVEIPVAGKYRVEFDYSCDDTVAGNRWRMEGSGSVLAGEVGSTGDWETYRQVAVGELQLERGEQRIVLRAARQPHGALFDLRSIRLAPIK